NHDDGRFERDDVLTEAHEHLRRRLPADAATNVRLAGKLVGEETRPAFSDRVAHEDDALFAGRREGRGELAVCFAISAEVRPVITPRTVGGALAVGDLRGRRRGGGWLLRPHATQTERHERDRDADHASWRHNTCSLETGVRASSGQSGRASPPASS